MRHSIKNRNLGRNLRWIYATKFIIIQVILCQSNSFFYRLNFKFPMKATQSWQNLPFDLAFTLWIQNQLEDFVSFLWPSQNIWTLTQNGTHENIPFFDGKLENETTRGKTFNLLLQKFEPWFKNKTFKSLENLTPYLGLIDWRMSYFDKASLTQINVYFFLRKWQKMNFSDLYCYSSVLPKT